MHLHAQSSLPCPLMTIMLICLCVQQQALEQLFPCCSPCLLEGLIKAAGDRKGDSKGTFPGNLVGTFLESMETGKAACKLHTRNNPESCPPFSSSPSSSWCSCVAWACALFVVSVALLPAAVFASALFSGICVVLMFVSVCCVGCGSRCFRYFETLLGKPDMHRDCKFPKIDYPK